MSNTITYDENLNATNTTTVMVEPFEIKEELSPIPVHKNPIKKNNSLKLMKKLSNKKLTEIIPKDNSTVDNTTLKESEAEKELIKDSNENPQIRPSTKASSLSFGNFRDNSDSNKSDDDEVVGKNDYSHVFNSKINTPQDQDAHEEKKDIKALHHRGYSKYSVIVLGNRITDDEKRQLGLFKYNENVENAQNDVNDLREKKRLSDIFLKKKEKFHKTIKYKSKKKKTQSQGDLEDLEIQNDDHLPEDKRKTLPNKLKKQFQTIKIKDLSNPDRLENYNEEKFVREKGEGAKQANNLNREISILLILTHSKGKVHG